MELGKPELPPFYNPAESFLRGFALMSQVNARKAALESRVQQIALENQALAQRTQQQRAEFGLREQKFALDAQKMENMGDYQAQRLALAQERELRTRDIAERTLSAQDQKLKLQEEKARATLESQAARYHADRLGQFNKTLQQYGLPYDAFENTQNWKKRDDGKMYVEIPVRDKAGAQLYSDNPKETIEVEEGGKKVKRPKPLSNFVTIKPDTYQWLESTYKQIKGDAVTPQMIPQDEPKPAPNPKVRVKAPNGSFGYVPSDQLDAAKSEGYVEAPQ